jgi:hypothetical protein
MDKLQYGDVLTADSSAVAQRLKCKKVSQYKAGELQ